MLKKYLCKVLFLGVCLSEGTTNAFSMDKWDDFDKKMSVFDKKVSSGFNKKMDVTFDKKGKSKTNIGGSSLSGKEKVIPCQSFEEARDQAFNSMSSSLKKLDQDDRGNVSPFKGYERVKDENGERDEGLITYAGRLGKGKDKVVGIAIKGSNKETAVLRSDYDPEKGPHLNVNVGKGRNNEKYAFTYPGDEEHHSQICERLSRPDNKNGPQTFNTLKNFTEEQFNKKVNKSDSSITKDSVKKKKK